MAATGKTPILLYGSTTPTNTPAAGNLTNSSDGCEIAINVADKNLFFKDSTNAVNTVPIRQSSASSNGWLSSTDWSTFNGKVSSQWTTSGSNVYYLGGVGVGVNPNAWAIAYPLQVRGASLLSEGSNLYITANSYYGSGAWTYIDSTYASQYYQLNGLHVWRTAASGTAGNATTFSTVFSTDASNNLNIATGNLVIGTSGKGIDFSATAGTGTSELLADYEEGTWTPAITAAAGSITSYTVQQAQYTKVGRLVTVTLRYTITNAGTGAGATIATLPYTAAYDGVGTCVELAALGVSGRAWVPATTASVYITKYDNTTLIVTNYQVNATVSYMV